MYIKGTHQQVTDYINKVNTARNWGGVTNTWAEPRKHPTDEVWSCPVHKSITPDAGEVVETLDEGWNDNTIDP